MSLPLATLCAAISRGRYLRHSIFRRTTATTRARECTQYYCEYQENAYDALQGEKPQFQNYLVGD